MEANEATEGEIQVQLRTLESKAEQDLSLDSNRDLNLDVDLDRELSRLTIGGKTGFHDPVQTNKCPNSWILSC